MMVQNILETMKSIKRKWLRMKENSHNADMSPMFTWTI